MSQFFPVDYSVGQQYFIETTAFYQAVRHVFEYYKKAKLLDVQVKISEPSKSLWLDLKIEVARQSQLCPIIKTLEEELDDLCYSLVDGKATNIKIDVVER
ncbi:MULTISPECIES: MMB_0454 family protein [unclassified Mycoplasma]|uniref:MMB_0454 family protein n=1 Tax=unclassified Mycoplasma TaxID=2683645 RepID=UPI000FDEA934